MLDYVELEELLDEIREKVTLANRTGNLDSILRALGMENWLKPAEGFESYKDGKIVVIGQTSVKEEELRIVAKKAGIGSSRFEFCLEYEATKTFQYSKLQYAPQYRVVLVGPIPHSSTGKADSSSVISKLESAEGYPRVVRLTNGKELKITKSNFKQALSALITENYIAC